MPDCRALSVTPLLPENYERARQCINACANIDKPEKIPDFIVAAKRLLEKLGSDIQSFGAESPVTVAEQDFLAALNALGVKSCA